MPPIPRTSPTTSLPTPPHYIHTASFSFIDVHGRTLLLRGVNLSGASKAPVGRLSHVLEDFWESAERDEEGGEGLSFVGRPLRLEDGSADVHLARLRGWGFNLIRFPFTWEALEHAGPGKYDYEFMDYTIQVLVKCKEYGFRVYMDPHQDTWSRFSGGSGAPYWTLPACGINPRNITATQAAILHCEYPTPYPPEGPQPATLPAMIWSTNYGRLLSQTLFTLFFAGRVFAPKCIIDGMNIQDYLQSHFLASIRAFSSRLASYEGGALLDSCVIGWDSLNEPFEGLVGWGDLNKNPESQGSTLRKGTYPTPAQSFRLGMGKRQEVEHWVFGAMGPRRDGSVVVDPKGRKVWADPVSADPSSSSAFEDGEGGERRETTTTGELPDGTHPKWGWKRNVDTWPLGTCIWALHGVWDVETGYILQPDYFRYRYTPAPAPAPSLAPGSEQTQPQPQPHLEIRTEVDFLTDFWKPHWLAYSACIRASHPDSMIFVQPPVFAVPPRLTLAETHGRCVYSPHYYDGLTLITRHWNWFNADALGLLRGRYGSTLGAVKLGEGSVRRSLWEQMGYLREDVGMLGGVDEDDEDESLSEPSASSSSSGSSSLGKDRPESSPNSKPKPKPEYPGLGEYPTLIGEIGTPFDMDGKKAYGWTDKGRYRGDYSAQERALDASLQGCDARDEVPKRVRAKSEEKLKLKSKSKTKTKGRDGDGTKEDARGEEDKDEEEEEEEEEDKHRRRQEGSLSWTVWTYVPDDHSHAWGDGWNLEDLSLWSVDDLDLDLDLPSEEESDFEEEEGMGGDTEDAEEMRELGVDVDEDAEEDGMHSRAHLLTDPTNTKRSKTRKTNDTIRRQPSKKAPMSVSVSASALESAMSLDTLDVHGRRRGVDNRKSRTRAREGSVSSSASSVSTLSTTSTLSLPKHNLAKPSPLPSPTPTPSALIRAGYSPNPYTLLTAGARAYRAFSRPWPVKVVGKAVEVRFDVAKGVFWMKVRCGWDDRVVERDDAQREGEKLGTEVYLPLVHFAHGRLLDGRFERELSAKARAEEEKLATVPARRDAPSVIAGTGVDIDVDADVVSASGSGSGSSSTVAGSVDIEEEDRQVPSSMTSSTSSPQKPPPAVPPTSSSSPSSSSAPLLIRDDTPDLIDVEVKVSGGTYEVRGQGLVWWYDVPSPPPSSSSASSSSSKAKDDKWEYTIEVRRRGGALPSPNKPKPRPKPSNTGAQGIEGKEQLRRRTRGREGKHVEDLKGGGEAGTGRNLLERICCPEDGGGIWGWGCVVA